MAPAIPIRQPPVDKGNKNGVSKKGPKSGKKDKGYKEGKEGEEGEESGDEMLTEELDASKKVKETLNLTKAEKEMKMVLGSINVPKSIAQESVSQVTFEGSLAKLR